MGRIWTHLGGSWKLLLIRLLLMLLVLILTL